MRKAYVIGGLIAIVLAAAATQVSILTLGTDDDPGTTVVVRRTGPLEKLQFIDSARAACAREVRVRNGGRTVEGYAQERMCAGRLAIAILDRDLALVRFGYSRVISKLANDD